MRIGLIISIIFWSLILIYGTGCAAIIGVKSYESGTGKDGVSYQRWAFTQGLDFGVSANAVDSVKNSRGISPSVTNVGNH